MYGVGPPLCKYNTSYYHLYVSSTVYDEMLHLNEMGLKDQQPFAQHSYVLSYIELHSIQGCFKLYLIRGCVELLDASLY